MKPKVIDRHDTRLAMQVIETTPGAFLMGSYPVLKMDARDVDVAVPEKSWRTFTLTWGTRFDLTHNADEEVYTDDAPAFLCNYRNLDGGRVNVLVIRDAYVEAMQSAAAVVASDPDKYRDADARVRIYQEWEKTVR